MTGRCPGRSKAHPHMLEPGYNDHVHKVVPSPSLRVEERGPEVLSLRYSMGDDD